MTTQTHPVDHELIQAAAHVARTRCRATTTPGQPQPAPGTAAVRARDDRIVECHHL